VIVLRNNLMMDDLNMDLMDAIVSYDLYGRPSMSGHSPLFP
jgi:hypothetical protein